MHFYAEHEIVCTSRDLWKNIGKIQKGIDFDVIARS